MNTDFFKPARMVIVSAAAFLATGVFAQTPTVGDGAGQPAPSAKSVATTLTNEDVLKLNEAGLGDDVIIAKINAATQAAFRVETDDLIGLKKAGVSQNIIAAMVRRSGSASVAPTEAPSGNVEKHATSMLPVGMPAADDFLIRLVTKDGATKLISMEGHISTVYAFVTVLMFTDFPGLRADVRIRDQRPHIIIQSSKSPQGRFFLVRCESNKKSGDRSVKQGRGGLFTNKSFGAPDADWTVPFDVKQLEPGLWRMDPKQDLKPGEYGVYGGWFAMADLYDFGVDG